MSFDKIVEAIIKEAQARGQFDNLSGKGKSIDLTEYFNTPEDVRVAQTMLKNAGMVPVEIELLQEITLLKESLKSINDSVRFNNSQKLIKEKQLQLNILLEKHRR